VSLMDIFTILVFFLLVNSADVETISTKDGIKLPESISEMKPRETLIITVNETDILVQGRKVSDVVEVLGSDSEIITSLKRELEFQLDKSKVKEALRENVSAEVTIMGDKNIPYKLLKKIMLTCAESNYGNISLAVQQKEKG
ncbi:MAG: biopolymer transporter ExbD, partial [Gammaproteobacteria bacterium]|nr:biopolymer transporter ExbD [Gammaproteobacteria bacterium]